jgi:hypothetical protein
LFQLPFAVAQALLIREDVNSLETPRALIAAGVIVHTPVSCGPARTGAIM